MIDTLPLAEEAERALIGAAIIKKELPPEASELSVREFFNPDWGEAYRAFLELDADGLAIDPIAAKPILERNGSTLTVSDLMSAVNGVPPTSAADLVAAIRDAAERRRWIKEFNRITVALSRGEIALDEVPDLLRALELEQTARRSSGLDVEFLSTVEAKTVRWLARPLIPRGFFTLCDGIEGIGKTYAMLDLAKRLTRGEPMPFGGDAAAPGNVLLLSIEDSAEFVLRPRAEAMGADLERIAILRGAFEFDAGGFAKLEKTIAEHRIEFVVIDPIFSFTGRSDINSTADVRPITDRLNQIAAAHDISVVGIRHINKSKGYGDPRSAGAHSVAWLQGARSALLIGHDTNDKSRRAVLQHKLNIGPESKTAFGFTIDDAGRFEWTGISELTAEDILSHKQNDNQEERSKKKAAIVFLEAELADGPVPARMIMERGLEAGISRITLERAKAELRVESYKVETAWFWRLREDHHQHHHQSQ